MPNRDFRTIACREIRPELIFMPQALPDENPDRPRVQIGRHIDERIEKTPPTKYFKSLNGNGLRHPKK
jgi:hypothetical protein